MTGRNKNSLLITHYYYYNDNAKKFFQLLIANYKSLSNFVRIELEQALKQTADQAGIKQGEIMQLHRVLLTGQSSGADLIEILELLGKDEVIKRLETGIRKIDNG